MSKGALSKQEEAKLQGDAVEDDGEESGTDNGEDSEEETDAESGEEESSEGSEETDSDDSDYEEKEPPLKYHRLGADIPRILQTDSATAFTATSRFAVLGTANGNVHVLDATMGTIVSSFNAEHDAPVTCLDVDAKGDWVASCADDGKIVIRSLYDDQFVSFVTDRPLKAVAIDPTYGTTKKRRCIAGGMGGTLDMFESSKNVLGMVSRKRTTMHQGEGPVRAISWHRDLVAWANDMYVWVMDLRLNATISNIKKPSPNLRPDISPCRLCWKGSDQLIVGWGQYLTFGTIVDQPPAVQADKLGAHPAHHLPQRSMRITCQVMLECTIAGLALFGNDYALLGYSESKKQRGGKTMVVSDPPMFQILSTYEENGAMQAEEQSSDALPIINLEHLTPKDYNLTALPGELIFYIVTPSDVLNGKPPTIADRVDWLFSKGHPEEALEVAIEHEFELGTTELTTVYNQFMEELVKLHRPNDGAKYAPRILRDKADLWKQWIQWFIDHRALDSLAPLIPIKSPRLDPKVYSNVLNYFLEHNKALFLDRLNRWPQDLYDLDELLSVVQKAYDEDYDHNRQLAESYAYLLRKSGSANEAVTVLLKCSSPKVFDVIREEQTFQHVQARIRELVAVDVEMATALLASSEMREAVPPKRVLPQIESDEEMTLKYLEALMSANAVQFGRDYGSQFVTLAAKVYDDEPLMRVLKAFLANISLLEAYEACRKHQRWLCAAFLLRRQHKLTEAVDIMIDKLNDVNMAIEVALEEHQNYLWQHLIDSCLSSGRPDFVLALLRTAGTHIDPLLILNNPKLHGLSVPGLRDAVVQIIQDFNLQIELLKGCTAIMVKDCVGLQRRLNTLQKRPMEVNPFETECAICAQGMVGQVGKEGVAFVSFTCTHAYHLACLQEVIKAKMQERGRGRRGGNDVQNDAQQLFCVKCRSAAEQDRRQRRRGRTSRS